MASPATTMSARPQRTPGRATRVVVATFGVLAALAGIEHGIGEVLQGSVVPPGLVFASWPDAQSFAILDGEPAMTVIPNLLVSGIMAVATALALGGWAVARAGRRYGGPVLLALSVVLLLVGGGFGPPVVGVILGIAVQRGASTSPAPTRGRRALGQWWPWFTGAGVTGFLGLMPGTVLLDELFAVRSSALVYAFAALAFGGLILAVAAARAHDLQALTPRHPRPRPAHSTVTTP